MLMLVISLKRKDVIQDGTTNGIAMTLTRIK
jgi:hypothetical protein